VDLTDT